MELLVVTLAHSRSGSETEGQSQIRMISSTVRSAPGLLTARFYSSNQGHDQYYLMLTTWEDEEAWQKARERADPRQLYQNAASRILVSPPEQWRMHYLWGYNRPAASATLVAALLTTTRPDKAEYIQKNWLESLHRQAAQPMLASAFLARGINENAMLPTPARSTPSNGKAGAESPYRQGSIFLNLLSWSNEDDQEAFYTDAGYQGIYRLLGNLGAVQALTLEAL
ncbi:MAG: antibiotic biosynthesis monooxygenase [Chloroflexota bacterium]|nr:antibiotic biosynthesis monooxygenase [Chloroflexota bacterium]